MARAVSFTQAGGNLTIQNARVVFEPNAYDDSDCPRKNIVLEVDDNTTGTIREWEADLDPSKLVSAISQYGMRCKIQTDTVRVWSDDGKPPNDATNNPQPTCKRNRAALRRLAYEEAVRAFHAARGHRIRQRPRPPVPVLGQLDPPAGTENDGLWMLLQSITLPRSTWRTA